MRILEDNEWDSSMTAEGYKAAPGQHPEPYHELNRSQLFRDDGNARSRRAATSRLET